MALVTIDDVESLVKTAFSAEEEAALTLLIDTMTGELEDFCGRPVSPRAFTDELHTVPETGRIFLANSPVVSIQGVHYATAPTTAFTGTYVLAAGGLTFGTSVQTYDLLVDYTAGLSSPANVGLKSILLNRLSRIMAKVHDDAIGVSSLSQEGYNAAFLAEGWTEQELKIAERRRRRVVRT